MSASIKILLVLAIVAHTGFALKCYVCTSKDACTTTVDCPSSVLGEASCLTEPNTGARLCGVKGACIGDIQCCSTDLCNGSNSARKSRLLMGMAAALMTIMALMWK